MSTLILSPVKRCVGGLVLAGLLASCGGGSEDPSQQLYVIKFPHVTAPGTPKGQTAARFEDLAEARFPGRVDVEVYPSSQLMNDDDSLEALAFGEKGGLDMKTMLDVINVSSGQNFASQHFFPNHVLTETYDSAAQISISDKDIGLFVEEARAQGTGHTVAKAASGVIRTLANQSPDVDQTMIYPFIRDGDKPQH